MIAALALFWLKGIGDSGQTVLRDTASEIHAMPTTLNPLRAASG